MSASTLKSALVQNLKSDLSFYTGESQAQFLEVFTWEELEP